MTKQTILTGVKPTGTPHLGNLIGAIKPIIELAHNPEADTFVFVADLHALNFMRDAKELKDNVYDIASTFLALGLDPSRAILFRQSDIIEVPQLSTLLTNVTPKGLMNRAHSYKAKVEKNLELGQTEDEGINMGLYTYPILMAADILLYGTDLVPVGKDQKQHVEFARDIALSFNHLYGKDLFKLPEPVISETGCIIPGFDGRKMSKSYGNTIPIFSPESTLRKNIMKIKTDSKRPEEPKDPEESIIFQLYRNFATQAETQAMESAFRNGGLSYGDAKNELFRVINAYLAEPRNKYEYLMAHRNELDEILQAGAETARRTASRTLERVKKAMLGRV